MRRRAVFASLALVGTLWACSAEQRGRTVPPLAAAAAKTSDSPEAHRERLPPQDPVRLEDFVPLLAIPELEKAARAVEEDDFRRAVAQVEAAMAKHPPEADRVPSWQMLLGRLREQAGDLEGATASYELAAAKRWLLTGYAHLGAGRVLLRSGRHRAAIQHLVQVPTDQPIARERRLLIAEAASLLGERALAIATWRESLETDEGAADRPTVALRLAGALIDEQADTKAPDVAALAEAHRWARTVAIEAAGAEDIVEKAKEVEQRALAAMPPRERAKHSRPRADEELVRLRVLVEARRHSDADAVALSLLGALGKRGAFGEIGCEARFLRAKALSGEREWGRAAEVLGDVVRLCKDDDLKARALYLAGRYSDYDKRYALAIRHYAKLESELPGHRLADDARLLRASSYRKLGDEARFTDLLSRMASDYPSGDMVYDGVFTLALSRIEKGDWRGTASVLERGAELAAAQDKTRSRAVAGRERYFRARAWEATGDRERAFAEYETLVREVPLSYYMLHAYSRLHRLDRGRAERARNEAMDEAATDPFSFKHRPEFDQPGFLRALELLRLGDVEQAQREIVELGLASENAGPEILWGVALLYARAGAAKLSHTVARGLLTDWLERWPAGDWAKAWEVAFPRPYRRLVSRTAKKNGLPEYLVYAVMREESAFEPTAVSPAGAYGLMQVIEPTARHYAAPLGLPSDPESLTKPEVNVPIGCRVLSSFMRTLGKNPLLAIPGYNAGPGRPRRWLRERPEVDFDVWVELIPFRETRRYTKRVLASRAAYAFLYEEDSALDAMRLPERLRP